MEPIEQIPNISVQQIGGRTWLYKIPVIPNNHPPVTLQLGFPIVELPGCVETHKDNKIDSSRLPLDRDLVNDDPNGVTILCPHGEYPSYDAMNYEPEQVIPTSPTPPPPIAPPAAESLWISSSLRASTGVPRWLQVGGARGSARAGGCSHYRR